MKCKICLNSNVKVFKMKEKILGTSIADLISQAAGVQPPKGMRFLVCSNCCFSLFQAKCIADKTRSSILAMSKKDTSSVQDKTVIAKLDESVAPVKNKEESLHNGNSEKPKKLKSKALKIAIKKSKNDSTVSEVSDQDVSMNDTSIAASDMNITSNSSHNLSNVSTPKEKASSKIPCLSCGKRFSDSSRLEAHMEKAHKKVESYDCPNCGAIFRSKEKYDKHVFNEKCSSSIYPCQEASCSKRFSNMKTMQSHMVKFHPLSIYCTSQENSDM